MLPAHIIEEILRRKRDKERSDELFVDPPSPEPIPDDAPGEVDDDEQDDRGVAIIDFTV